MQVCLFGSASVSKHSGSVSQGSHNRADVQLMATMRAKRLDIK